MKTESTTTPAIFFGHGSPMNAIEENQYTKAWVEMIQNIPKPENILVISAHWETDGSRITSNKKQKTIHDFYEFPQELFEVQYNPNGSEELVKDLQRLIPEVISDESWGLDHGAWSILGHIYKDADIPVLQLSIDRNKSLQEHYNFAKKLIALRDKKVLIIGSGNIVHNLQLIKWRGDQTPYDFALSFNNLIKDAILKNQHDKIINYTKLEGASKSVPSLEHFIPLLYVLALQKEEEQAEIFAEGIELGSISMNSVLVS